MWTSFAPEILPRFHILSNISELNRCIVSSALILHEGSWTGTLLVGSKEPEEE
jgi:hypothetical protein